MVGDTICGSPTIGTWGTEGYVVPGCLPACCSASSTLGDTTCQEECGNVLPKRDKNQQALSETLKSECQAMFFELSRFPVLQIMTDRWSSQITHLETKQLTSRSWRLDLLPHLTTPLFISNTAHSK